MSDLPALYLPPGRGRGGLPASGSRGRPPGRPPGPGAPTDYTDEQGRLLELRDTAAVDPVIAARVRQIAARLAVPRPRRERRGHRGPGELLSRRWTGSADELDLDASLEALAANPVPDDDELVVRERARSRRSVVLVIDTSGSMRGERVRTAAATVGALVGELERDNVAVVAFWSDAVVLSPIGSRPGAAALLEDLLRLPAQGLTNVAFPLTGRARSYGRRRRATRGSCCCPTASTTPDPIRGWRRPTCPGSTSCSTRPARTTPSSAPTWPGSGAGASSGSVGTATSRPRCARSSTTDRGAGPHQPRQLTSGR